MSNVILINPRQPYLNFGDDMGVHQPLGLMQLGSHLIENGIQAKLIDANAMNIPNEDIKIPQSAKLVSISVSTVMFPVSVKIAKSVKEKYPDVFVIAGGSHFMSMPHTLEGTPFDAAFGGAEADSIIAPFTKHILDKGKIDYSTPGLIYMNGKLNRNPNPGFVKQEDLDKVPHPYKHANAMGFDMGLYKPYSNTAVYGKGKYATAMTSRGCVYKCTYCLEAEVFNRTFRFHSAKYVYDMLLDIERLGAKQFYFMDSEWSIARQRNMELMKMMVDDKKDWVWECLTRATDYTYSTLEYPKLMKKAGCISTINGVESGSDETLKRIKKSATKDDYRRSFKILRDCGIERRASFMMGFPWETLKDLDDTLKFAIELDPDFAYFQILTPYMGTPIYEEVKPFLKYDAEKDFSNWWQHSIIGAEVMVKTEHITAEQLKRKNAEAYKKFYFRPSYILRQLVRSINKPYRLKMMSKNAFTLLNQIVNRSKSEDQPMPQTV